MSFSSLGGGDRLDFFQTSVESPCVRLSGTDVPYAIYTVNSFQPYTIRVVEGENLQHQQQHRRVWEPCIAFKTSTGERNEKTRRCYILCLDGHVFCRQQQHVGKGPSKYCRWTARYNGPRIFSYRLQPESARVALQFAWSDWCAVAGRWKRMQEA